MKVTLNAAHATAAGVKVSAGAYVRWPGVRALALVWAPVYFPTRLWCRSQQSGLNSAQLFPEGFV